MSEKPTPLDEFEFRQAAEIRKPAEEHVKHEPKPKKKVSLARIFWMLLCLSAVAALWYCYYLLRNQQSDNMTLRTENATLQKEVSELNAKIQIINSALKEVNGKFSTSRKGKEQLLGTIDSFKVQLREKDQKIDNLNSRIAKLQSDIDRISKTEKKIRSENATLKENVARQEDKAKSLQKKLDNANQQVTDLNNTLGTLKSDMNREGSASRQLVSDLLDAQTANKKLKDENVTLMTKVKKVQSEMTALKRVDEGELVPLSDDVQLAAPIIHPVATIAKKGLFGKGGFVVLNVLIDETGLVQNASYLDARMAEKEQTSLAMSSALRTIMKWRFSPALYKGETRVKVWQPVVVPVEVR